LEEIHFQWFTGLGYTILKKHLKESKFFVGVFLQPTTKPSECIHLNIFSNHLKFFKTMKTLVLSIILLSGTTIFANTKSQSLYPKCKYTFETINEGKVHENQLIKTKKIKKKSKKIISIFDNPYKDKNLVATICCTDCPIYRPCN
jgi:hypothetical protein